jgi:hypothetical protein
MRVRILLPWVRALIGRSYEEERKLTLPIVRSGERATYKRCPKKWYWAWRKGYVLRTKKFDALELGTWWHNALAKWYRLGFERNDSFTVLFAIEANASIEEAQENGAPEHVIEKADELSALGLEMAHAYEREYGMDKAIRVLATEITLEFGISNLATGLTIANHRITPDLVYMDSEGRIWLMEHKTAKSIRTEHLVIDDQARPYSAMARRALIKAEIIQSNQDFAGIMYNYARKALPDLRERNSDGKYLNKNGSISKTQPPPYFRRFPVFVTKKAKIITLKRVQRETEKIVTLSNQLRRGDIDPSTLDKTPHHSCPRTCDFFAMCVAEEEGSNISTMERTMYIRQNPYEKSETADEPVSFEMG